MNTGTFADIYRPAKKTSALKYDIALVIGGSIFMAICAQISFHIPFNPVPITGQTFGVLLTGAVLGSNRGSLAMLAYLTEGAAGLPFFAGGSAGFPYLIGPTGGYLLGFVLAAFIVGRLTELSRNKRIITAMPIMLLGTVIIFITGLSWLSRFIGIDQVLAVGLYPFIPGAILKIIVAAILLPVGWRLLGRN